MISGRNILVGLSEGRHRAGGKKKIEGKNNVSVNSISRANSEGDINGSNEGYDRDESG